MLRVVYYGRVSTDSEEQQESLISQQEYFIRYIEQNKEWQYVDKYIDEGITGTSVKRRKDFLRMIKDAHENKFDLILTREVSRFARNTVDTLRYTRELKSLNVGVIFTLDNIDTRDKDGELRLTIMASLAQEEARKTSNNVKWKQEHLMRNGVVFGNNNILGYNVVNKKLVVNEEEAETVKLIFNLYLQGYGYRRIQNELIDKELRTATGLIKWDFTSIPRILTNEKYAGTLIQRKYKTIDYLDKKKTKNPNSDEYIIIENNHEPIISKETFNAVQDEMKRRSAMTKSGTKYESRHVFSNKIQCGQCGHNFRRATWNRNKNGTKTYGWECSTSHNLGKRLGCDAKGVSENIINNVIKKVFENVYKHRKNIIKTLEEILEKNLNNISNEVDIVKSNNMIERYQEKINDLLDLYTDKLITKIEFQQKKEEYERIIIEQKELLERFNNLDKEKLTAKRRIEIIKQILEKLTDSDSMPSDDIINNLLDHIIIYSKNHIEIFLVIETMQFTFKDGSLTLDGHSYISGGCAWGIQQNTVSIFSFYMKLQDKDFAKTKVDVFMAV